MKDRIQEDAILQLAERIKLGSLLQSIAGKAGGLTDAEVEYFDQLRSKTSAEPMRFECQWET